MALPSMRNTEGLSDREIIRELQRYITELKLHLDWQLGNLDESNFTDEFKKKISGE